jgi:hypothetical protein
MNRIYHVLGPDINNIPPVMYNMKGILFIVSQYTSFSALYVFQIPGLHLIFEERSSTLSLGGWSGMIS